MIIKTRRGSTLYKALTLPVYTTKSHNKAGKSKYPWHIKKPGVYQLRILGLLHRWINLTLDVK